MNLYDTPIPPRLAREIDRLYTEAETAAESAQRAEKQAARLMAYAQRRRAAVDSLTAEIEAKYKSVKVPARIRERQTRRRGRHG